MIAVKKGWTDLTNTLLRGGCDIDVQENVRPMYIDLQSSCAPLCVHQVEYVHAAVSCFEALLWKVGNENNGSCAGDGSGLGLGLKVRV